MRNALVFFIALMAAMSLAHMGEEAKEHDIAEEMPIEDCSTESCFIEDSASYGLLAAEAGLAVLIAVSLLCIAFRKKLKRSHKKAVFALMAATIIAVTSFLAVSTVYANYFSYSGGPVHWHADYEIWICGERMSLDESEGLENKVGTPVFHHHNDNRIHVEGVVMKMEDIYLGKFFEAIGGHLDSESLKIRLIDGSVKEFRNGDLCSEIPSGIAVFVNDREIFDFDKYILAPYSTVPPGDFINITTIPFPLPPTASLEQDNEIPPEEFTNMIKKFGLPASGDKT